MAAAEAWTASWAPALAAGVLTVIITRGVRGYLERRQILDHPNDRSSHQRPTPRGGGLATTPVLAAILLLLAWLQTSLALALLGLGALTLLAISWVDDRKGLPPLPRFLAHAGMIALFLALVPGDLPVFGGLLPLWADRLVAGLGWLWFVNLFNFMDGIDGITGTEAASLGLGIALIATIAPIPALLDLIPPGLAVTAVGIAFLVWNWHPAKLFLGDSGSVPLGYVLGGLLLLLALHGQLAAALILPAYYLADATLTLGRRALAREKIWQAHRKHFYQRAVLGGRRHDEVVRAILAANAALLAAALLAASGRLWEGVLAALVITAALLALLQAWSKGKPQ